MNHKRRFAILAIFFTLLFFAALACGPSATVTPTTDLNIIVAQTMAALTNQAVPPSTSQAPAPATATQEETAPSPLPASNTGFILENGQCINFDTGTVTAPDQSCDAWLVEPGLLRPMNGARISGYVTMDPPTRSHCAAAQYEPGDLAVQTDLYMCFISNEGNIGFIVAREYRGGALPTGIVYDYWLFH